MHFAARFSAALCRGLIEATTAAVAAVRSWRGFPRLYAAASLKRAIAAGRVRIRRQGFPRLYAAASLKRLQCCPAEEGRSRFSAALCRGLIEAGRSVATGSHLRIEVFRGFMPRPH